MTETTTETTELAPAERVPVAIDSGSTGIQLRTFDEIWRYAGMLANSQFVPKDMRGKTPDVMAAIQLGAELGLQPMAAIQNIAVINGRPSVWGDLQLAICQKSGIFDFEAHDEYFEGKPFDDDYTAVTVMKRIGASKPVVSRYSVADANRAGLWKKSGSWTTNPGRMLKYRSRAFAARDAFADVLKGLYSREEMEGAERDTVIGTPVAVQPAKSRAEQLVGQLAPPAALPKPTPDPPSAPANETTTKGPPPPDEAAPEPEPKPDAQIGEGPLYRRIAEAYTGLTKALKDKVRVSLEISLVTDCKKMNTAQAAHALAVIADAGKVKIEEA